MKVFSTRVEQYCVDDGDMIEIGSVLGGILVSLEKLFLLFFIN